MNKGTVKFFNDEKRFGFITPEDGSKDVFVHKNGTKNRIVEGDQVEYELEDGPKGPSAVNVSVL
jgi:CspA family cold shock protein